jgi:hypothetical protein
MRAQINVSFCCTPVKKKNIYNGRKGRINPAKDGQIKMRFSPGKRKNKNKKSTNKKRREAALWPYQIAFFREKNCTRNPTGFKLKNCEMAPPGFYKHQRCKE